jgi:hypothetical protein
MGQRGRFRMKTELNNDIEFKLYDSSYSSTVLEPEMNDFELVGTPSDNTLVPALITTELTLNFYDDGSAGISSMIESIETSSEPSITIEMLIDENQGAGQYVYWRGIIEKQSIIRMDMPSDGRQLIKLRAICGLSRLKDIEYPGIANGTHTGSSQIAQFITECLEENGLDSFWGVSEPYLLESIEWTSNQVNPPPGASDSPLLYTRCDVLKFRDDPKDEEPRNKTCFEVLEGIMQLFTATMMAGDGGYIIRQPRNHDGSYTQRSISKNLATVTSATVDHTQDWIDASTSQSNGFWDGNRGAEFGRRNALDIVRAKIIPGYLLSVQNQGFKQINSTNKDDTFTIPLGDLYGTSGDFFKFKWPIELKRGQWEIKITVTVTLPDGGTTYYLDFDQNTGDWSWSTSPASYVDYIPAKTRGKYTVYVETPDLPTTSASGCTATFRYEFWDRGTLAQPTTVGDQWAKAYPPEVELQNDNDVQATFEVEVANSLSSDESEVLDLGEIWFNDTALISTKNLFEINEAGSTWVENETWDAGFSTDRNLTFTMLLERMSYQQTPVKTWRGTLQGWVRPFMSIERDGEIYVCRRFSWMGKRDFLSGDWWRLNRAVGSIDIGDERETDSGDGIFRTKDPIEHDNSKDRYKQTERIGEVGAVIAQSSSVSSISLLNAIGHDNIKDGDTIAIIHPLTKEVLQTFTVDTDAASIDTSISVNTVSATYELLIGYIVAHDYWTVKSTDILRANQFQIKGQSADVDAANSTLYESSDAGGALSYKDSSGTVTQFAVTKRVTQNITSGQIAGLSGTSQTIKSAPGSGKYFQVKDAVMKYNAGLSAFNGDTHLILQYSGGQHIGYLRLYENDPVNGSGENRTADYTKYTSLDNSTQNSTYSPTWDTLVATGLGITQSSGDSTLFNVNIPGSYTANGILAFSSNIARFQGVVELIINGVPTGRLRSTSYQRNTGATNSDWWILEWVATDLELEVGDTISLQIKQHDGAIYDGGVLAHPYTLAGSDRSFIQFNRKGVRMNASKIHNGLSNGAVRFALLDTIVGEVPLNESIQLSCDVDLTGGDGDMDIVLIYDEDTF